VPKPAGSPGFGKRSGIEAGVNNRQQIENELRRWFRGHHGVIAFWEALALGASPGMIRQKLNSGEWVRVYRSVYRDAAVPRSGHQDLRAAHLATAGHGVASHVSAGWLWELLRQLPAQPELSIRRGVRDCRLPGVTVHCMTDLDVTETTTRRTIPVTNPLRTLVDLAGTATPQALTAAVDAALATRLVTVAGLSAELERLARRGRPGIDAFRRQLVQRGFVGAPAPSVLESKMCRLLASLNLPMPSIEFTTDIDGAYRLDFAWPEVWLAIEVDGYLYHFTPEHKERDENRRNRLQRRGWKVQVYNWRQVCREPGRVAAEIARFYRDLTR
jgi:very-short-patch-repair endonuclease